MTTKTTKASRANSGMQYSPEDLAPRNEAADEAALDAYLKRNKEALNASIEKAQAESARGEYFTLDQVMADIRAQQLRRRTRKP